MSGPHLHRHMHADGRELCLQQELRQAIGSAIIDRWRATVTEDTIVLHVAQQFADAILALPEVDSLLADRAAVQQVRAVRARVQRALDEGVPILQAQQVADHLDRALDGQQ